MYLKLFTISNLHPLRFTIVTTNISLLLYIIIEGILKKYSIILVINILLY
jgi:hypothetical protein